MPWTRFSCLGWRNFEKFSNRKFFKRIIYLIEKNALNAVCHVWTEEILKIFQIENFWKNHLSHRKSALNTICHDWSEEILKIFQIEIFEQNHLSHRKKCPEHGLSCLGWRNFEKFSHRKLFQKIIYLRKKCPEHDFSCLEWRNFENFSNWKFLKKNIYLIEKNALNTISHVWSEEILKIFQIENLKKNHLSYRKKSPEHGLSCLEWRNFENFSKRKFLKKFIYLIEENALNTVYHVWSEEILKIFQIENFWKKFSIS